MLFLHGLQQRRLGAGAGAVDFVGHQELTEDRSLDETETARAAIRFFQHLGAQNVGGHQVGRELDALVVEAEDRAHGVNEKRLGKTGHADKQRVTAGQHGDQRLVDHLLLAIDHFADGGTRRGDLGARGFYFLDGVAVRFTECLH